MQTNESVFPISSFVLFALHCNVAVFRLKSVSQVIIDNYMVSNLLPCKVDLLKMSLFHH